MNIDTFGDRQSISNLETVSKGEHVFLAFSPSGHVGFGRTGSVPGSCAQRFIRSGRRAYRADPYDKPRGCPNGILNSHGVPDSHNKLDSEPDANAHA